jgi:hypothetical protein
MIFGAYRKCIIIVNVPCMAEKHEGFTFVINPMLVFIYAPAVQ